LALLTSAVIYSGTGTNLPAQEIADFTRVDDAMLQNPPAEDWLMFSRTYDAQRHSPLDQVNVENVHKLQLAWSRGLPIGVTETIPLVHDGVMYVVVPGARVQALDAISGDLIWQYAREHEDTGERTKSLAIYADLILYTASDSYVVALDARTGDVRWQTRTDDRGHTSAPLVIEGKVITGGTCFGNRANCYLSAHDALSGKELWRFYTTPAAGEPGDESWHGAPVKNRIASTWGLPGSYDPLNKLIYWGIANPMPDMRLQRHNGDPDATGYMAPADLYSNSTVALRPETGELAWYYQHLPGDDADLDHTHERTLVSTVLDPDPQFVKWINPRIRRGEMRQVAVTVPEGGGIFVNDRITGEFLWAMPFPFETPLMLLDDIDVTTGRTVINKDLIAREAHQQRIVCYWNTRSYWPTAYHPGTNSLYTSYIDNCREISGQSGRGGWRVIPRPGADPAALTGIAKINLETGEVLRFDSGRAPGNGALLTTAGNLVFHGDMSRRFKAFDAATGKQLWQVILGGNVSVSTITYAVEGRQYVAVMTGENLKVPELLGVVPELELPRNHNEIYVFALPDNE
jgi:alcohol dehydrogenase (cytochrome c)